MPTRAQQSCVGTAPTNPGGGGLATAGGGIVARIPGTAGAIGGWMGLSLTVAFIGESGVLPIRAVSLRGPACEVRAAVAAPNEGGGGFGPGIAGDSAGGGTPGVIESGEVFAADGGDAFVSEAAATAGIAAGGEPGVDPLADGNEGGRTAAGERAIAGAGGRLTGGPPVGGDAFAASVGGRFGRLIRTVSFSGAGGRLGLSDGSVIRTVSFFGSLKSAMTTE